MSCIICLRVCVWGGAGPWGGEAAHLGLADVASPASAAAAARAAAVVARQVHRKLVERVFLRQYGPEYESRAEAEAAERAVELSAECAGEGHTIDMCTAWLLAARSYVQKRVVTVHSGSGGRGCEAARVGDRRNRQSVRVSLQCALARETHW